MTPDRAIAELVAAVERPIGEARGLANCAYTSEALFRLELERIFAPSWACLGHACDVPQPGDVRPVRLLGVPLLMVRTRTAAVRVFHNVCSHRGNELGGRESTAAGSCGLTRRAVSTTSDRPRPGQAPPPPTSPPTTARSRAPHFRCTWASRELH